MPRILIQALKLRLRHGLPIYDKPEPQDVKSYVRTPLSPLQRLGHLAFRRILGGANRGHLIVEYPDGARESFGNPSAGSAARIHIRRPGFFSRILRGGAIGFGDAYMAGDWDSPDLTTLLIFFIENLEKVDSGARILNALQKPLGRLPSLPRKIGRARSRENVEAHYDLGNRFFELFLDPSMMYSSGQYRDDEDTLETAQSNKLCSLLTKAGARAEDHILDIGCGWGGLAIYAATQFGCRVTGITLSREQLAYARTRAEREGVTDRVTFKLCDYRDIEGSFDAIISVEMLEAVGAKDLPGYFRACDRLLKPGGRVVLQVITIADHRYENYLRNGDWIQKEIFPGQTLSSRRVLDRAMREATAFQIADEESLTDDYARTLQDWRLRLENSWSRARAGGYEESFLRKWRYYFGYCEAGFRMREVGDWQLVLMRAGDRSARPDGAPDLAGRA